MFFFKRRRYKAVPGRFFTYRWKPNSKTLSVQKISYDRRPDGGAKSSYDLDADRKHKYNLYSDYNQYTHKYPSIPKSWGSAVYNEYSKSPKEFGTKVAGLGSMAVDYVVDSLPISKQLKKRYADFTGDAYRKKRKRNESRSQRTRSGKYSRINN